MKAYFRVDASMEIGTGHVMRCLTLADEMRRNKIDCSFVCRDEVGNLISLIELRGYTVKILPKLNTRLHWKIDVEQTLNILDIQSENIDLLILDHYQLDLEWEREIRKFTKTLLVIDDLANRKHECDILLDQTYGATENKYEGLIFKNSLGLFGIEYALLRPQFHILRKRCFNPADIMKIHVFFGGNDSNSHTFKFSKILLEHFNDIRIKAAVGKSYIFTDELTKLEKTYGSRFSWEKNISNMAQHMHDCDIAFGAPGTATWERACIGLPAAYVSTNPNQTAILNQLNQMGFCYFLGDAKRITDEDFVDSMKFFLGDRNSLKKMFQLNIDSVDGLGAERVVNQLIKSNGE